MLQALFLQNFHNHRCMPKVCWHLSSFYTWQRCIAKRLSHALLPLRCPAKERKHWKQVAGYVVFFSPRPARVLAMTSFIIIFISFMVFWSRVVFPYFWLKWTKAFLKLCLRTSLAFLSDIGDVWVCALFEACIIFSDECVRLLIPSRFFIQDWFWEKAESFIAKPGTLRAQFQVWFIGAKADYQFFRGG